VIVSMMLCRSSNGIDSVAFLISRTLQKATRRHDAVDRFVGAGRPHFHLGPSAKAVNTASLLRRSGFQGRS
jgi:hypothetical protein